MVALPSTWLASPAGATFVANRVEPAELKAREIHTERRTLERRMKRVAKRAKDVEAVSLKAMIARELGHRSLDVPSHTVSATQLVRALDRSALDALGQHAPALQRQAYDRVRNALQRPGPCSSGRTPAM
jgi:hypothetical protein